MRPNYAFRASSSPRPRGIQLSSIRAEETVTPRTHPHYFKADGSKKTATEITAETAEVLGGYREWRGRVDASLREIESSLDANAARAAGQRLNGGGTHDGQASDPEYRGVFADYVRRGHKDAEAVLSDRNGSGNLAEIQASFSEGSSTSGGYLAPVEWDRQIRASQKTFSPMRRLSNVVVTIRSAFSTIWTDELWGSGWVGETAARPVTSTPGFTPLVFPAGEIYAQPAATQRLLDDAAVDTEAWIATQLGDVFAREEGVAFIAGDGVNKPMGLLQYLPGGAGDGAHPGGNMGLTASGDAAKLTIDGLINLKYQLGTPYRQGASWLMNSNTAALITKMKDQQGNLIWRESLIADQPATLLGSPVEIDENMPDVAAGATPIAFGNFARGYLINDRMGVRMLRDPYSNKPFVMFYATKRVGGGLLDPKAIRVQKVAAS